MNLVNNEQFLTLMLEKTLGKLNQANSQNIILETQLKIANDKIIELEKGKNDSSIKQTESN